MANDTNPKARAIAAFAEMFFEKARTKTSLSDLEREAIDLGHRCMAEALGLALEALDAHLSANRPKGLRSHDIRPRTLASEVGDVSFSIRRYRDECGCDAYPLADALDIAYGTRISPGAAEFLVEAAAHVSYAKAARLLARHGSSVRPQTVMACMRQAGRLCAEQDEAAALSLYRDGVVPEAESVEKELCMEADGTYFSVQGAAADDAPKRLEVKAMVAYAGKEARGGKVHRKRCAHHALVGTPERLWSEGVASAVGRKYDLSKIERVHLGGDGERWCRDAGRYLPKAEVAFHLDPWHVNHAVLACFADSKLAWNILEVINDGGKEEAVALLEACLDEGLAREKQARSVISYLKGNIDHIALDGPSLGTMESENQHLYGVRMDSFPCAWSVRGASDMARIISRRESGAQVPRCTREGSKGERRRGRREGKELSFYEKQGGSGKVVKSIGSGYLPPHQADTRKMAPGKAYALRKGMAIMDRGI